MLKKVTLKQTVQKFKVLYVDAQDDTEARRLAFEQDNGVGYEEREAFRPARRLHKIEDYS